MERRALILAIAGASVATLFGIYKLWHRSHKNIFARKTKKLALSGFTLQSLFAIDKYTHYPNSIYYSSPVGLPNLGNTCYLNSLMQVNCFISLSPIFNRL